MKTLNLVMAGCALAGGIFWAYARWISPPTPENLGPFLERVNAEILKSAAQGRDLHETYLTLVVGDPEAPADPLLLTRGKGGFWGRLLDRKKGNEFVYRLAEAGYPLGWNPTVRLDTNNPALLDPFARMLVTAGEAGIPIRILAQGKAVAFVLEAAEAAGAPVVERLVGAGVRLGDIRPRSPRGKTAPPRKELIGDRILVWIDPEAVPRALHVEGFQISFERDPGYETWEQILIRALKAGAPALKPREISKPAPTTRRFRNKIGRTFDKTSPAAKSGLDMLKKEPAAVGLQSDGDETIQTAKTTRIHRIGDTGWIIPKTFKDATYLEPRSGGGATIGRSPHRVTIFSHSSAGRRGDERTARGYCERIGWLARKIDFRGFPAEACSRFPMPETSRPQAHHEVITIFDGPNRITLKYTYDTESDREGGLQMFNNILGLLEKETTSP